MGNLISKKKLIYVCVVALTCFTLFSSCVEPAPPPFKGCGVITYQNTSYDEFNYHIVYAIYLIPDGQKDEIRVEVTERTWMEYNKGDHICFD